MIRFTRITTIYSGAAKQFNNKISKNKNLNYDQLLTKFFSFEFGEKNNLTNELTKKNYKCNEVVANINFLQKSWKRKYLKKKNNKNTILNQIIFYRSNIVYFGNYSLISNDLIKELRKLEYVKKIMVFHCSPITLRIKKKLKLVDLIITCTDGYKIEMEKNLNKKVYKIPHAFNTSLYKVKNFEKRKYDVSFIGSLYIKSGLHLNRINLIFNLLKNFKNSYIAINFSLSNFIHVIKLFVFSGLNFSLIEKIKIIQKLIYILVNSKKTVYGSKMLNILSNSKIIVNSHIEDSKYAGNMRLFEGTGMGCMVLTDNKKGLSDIFKINREIITYNDLPDMIFKINYYLKNIKKLRQIAKSGLERTRCDHNYKKRAIIMDEIIKKNL